MLEERHSKVDNWNLRPQTVYRRSVTTKLTTGANHYVKVNQTNSHTNKTTNNKTTEQQQQQQQQKQQQQQQQQQKQQQKRKNRAKSTGANHYGKFNH